MTQNFFFYPHILDNLAPPESGFDVFTDMADKRLRLYVTARGAKTFFTRKRVNGKDQRIILGNYPAMSVNEARAKLDEVLSKLKNPIKPRKRNMQLSRAFTAFLDEKVHRSFESRKKLVRQFERLFADLYNKNLSDITTDELADLSFDIAKNHGAATANRMREVMTSLFNFAIDKNWASTNPAVAMQTFDEHRRQNNLTMAGLKKIVSKIKREKNPILRSAFLMLIFGFMSKSEVFSMKWDDLNLNRYFYKNTPLSDMAAVLLRNMPQTDSWIFPGNTGHIQDPRISWHKIVAAAGLPDTQMNDCTKLLRHQLKWSSDPEVLRENMNKVLEKLSAN